MIKITHLNLEKKSFNVAWLDEKGEVDHEIKYCKFVQGAKGPFISGPSTKGGNDGWINFAYIGRNCQAKILEAYNAAVMAAEVMEEEKTPFNPDDDQIPF